MSFYQLTAYAIAGALGERIKIARLNANLTQKALAQKAGLSLLWVMARWNIPTIY
ncbi:helix-turn-helix domain-containing protein [Colwellia sp. MT41]|uniref:helix-turn-helix domain-containing protein n=1 Tax=Colwellia sp. MT41 TaxID=58049 RepID=UPI001E31940C|nr:helix-turn-helix transcriptional regulator [Colwellia sp. MT41]